MSDTKPAYLIASSFMPQGHGSLEAYVEATLPLIAKAGAEALVIGRAGQPLEELEGDWPREAAMTVFKFPSKQALMAFWNSTEYQAVKHLRTDVVDSNFAIGVEGF